MIMLMGGMIGVANAFTDVNSENGNNARTSRATPITIYVDDDFTDDPANHKWNTIQEGIDDASDGDTVYVYPGMYTDEIHINKTITLMGENRDTTIIKGSYWSVVTMSAEWVNLSGFSITGAGWTYYGDFAGVGLSPYSRIENCKVYSNGEIGICVSDYNVVRNCEVFDTGGWGSYPVYGVGIRGDDSLDNIITDCIIHNCWDGIWFSGYSKNNIIKNTTVSYNREKGIDFDYYTSNNKIINCTCSSNNYGIYLHGTSYNIVTDCAIYLNREKGIYLHGTSNNSITTCQVQKNYNGIYLAYSSYNNITSSTYHNNTDTGVYLSYSSNNNQITYCNITNNKGCGICTDSGYNDDYPCINNTIHHNNFVNNIQNAYDEGSNFWDNGYPNGGNYWNDYNGTDGNGDSIGDTPYNISNGSNQDNFPLMSTVEESGTYLDSLKYNLHAPIIIESNTNFTSANGVVSGSGTQSDPYIIEGWEICAPDSWYSSGLGIKIKNTNAYFIITNCYIFSVMGGRGSYTYGIYLINVTHGVIKNVVCYHLEGGITLSSDNTVTNCVIYDNPDYGIRLGLNCTVTNCTCYNNGDGIYMGSTSNNNTITNCTIYNNGNGVTLSGYYSGAPPNNNAITNCAVYNNEYAGIKISEASNTTIADCTIYKSKYGIYIGWGIYATYIISNCTCYNNAYYGIYIEGAMVNQYIISNCIFYNNGEGLRFYEYFGVSPSKYAISNCSFYNNSNGVYMHRYLSYGNITFSIFCNNSYGIYVNGSSSNYFHHNNFFNNTIQAYDESSDHWDDGVGEGNYWSDYTDGDENSDGIGDTPYNISGDSNQDHYPLMNPVEGAGAQLTSLSVTVNANPTTVNSAETSTITVHITNGTTPVSGATISLTSNHGGSFSSVIDNSDGTYTATFTAPSVTVQTVCRITAQASKTGYIGGSGYVDVSVSPTARIIYVDDDGGADYTNIQDAIDNADNGDTVYVYAGTYGHTVINKPINLVGEDRDSTIIHAWSLQDGIYVTADGVNISGFTVKDNFYGIFLWSSNNTIRNCDISGNTKCGIYLEHYTANTTIANSNIYSNKEEGIFLLEAHNNIIKNCSVYKNKGRGISFICSSSNTIENSSIRENWCGISFTDGSSSNSIANCEVRANYDYGIRLVNSPNNVIAYCEIRYTTYYVGDGISLKQSSNNAIVNCTIGSNNGHGISLLDSPNNKITNCSIYMSGFGSYKGCGIFFSGSSDNIITNSAMAHNNYGVYLSCSSSNNIFYHNNIVCNYCLYKDTHQAYDECINTWNNTFKGNYWAGYTGIDSNNDGIGDTPYNIPGGAIKIIIL